jgi:hypothetical protein
MIAKEGYSETAYRYLAQYNRIVFSTPPLLIFRVRNTMGIILF